jgi:hypothetical protein
MSEYINIHGQQIEIRSSDPANPTLGQIWYNTTSSALKGYQFVQGWATGGNLGTARDQFSRSRNSNCGFRFWWTIVHWLHQPQKNMMVLLGLLEEI